MLQHCRKTHKKCQSLFSNIYATKHLRRLHVLDDELQVVRPRKVLRSMENVTWVRPWF